MGVVDVTGRISHHGLDGVTEGIAREGSQAEDAMRATPYLGVGT